MFISSTRAFVDVGTFHEEDEHDPCDKHMDDDDDEDEEHEDDETLYPCGQHMSWKSWQVLEGAFTPAISSVRDTIFLLILKIHDLVRISWK